MPTKGITDWLVPIRRPSCCSLELPGDHPNGDPATCWRTRDAGSETLLLLQLTGPGYSLLEDLSILLACAGPETLKLFYPQDPDASHLAIEYF